MKFFQRLGRSIMLPVAVLPVAAILSGISYWISSAAGGANIVSVFLGAAGGAPVDEVLLRRGALGQGVVFPLLDELVGRHAAGLHEAHRKLRSLLDKTCEIGL